MKTTNLFLITISLFLGACAQEKVTNVNPEFSAYVLRFQQIGSQMGVGVEINNITISYDSSLSGTNVLGVCKYGGEMIVPQVTINPQFWNSSSVPNSAREQLIFHELGHCILNRPHRTQTMQAADTRSQLPVSLMYPYHLNRTYYEGNYQHYLTELFLEGTPSAIYAGNVSSFPANVYASTASVDMEYKAVAKNLESVGLTDEDYADLENFGCDEH